MDLSDIRKRYRGTVSSSKKALQLDCIGRLQIGSYAPQNMSSL